MTSFGKQRLQCWLSGGFALASVALLAACSPSSPQSQPSSTTASPVASNAFPTLSHAPKNAAYLPWKLVSEDAQADRIYLSSSSAGCKIPWRAVITETSTQITISVVAKIEKQPCTARRITAVGWVHTATALAARSIDHGP